MKRAVCILLCLVLCLSLSVGVFASSGEASGAPGGGGAALPSGGGFGDVKTAVVNNSVVLVENGAVTVDEAAADVFGLADGGEISGTAVSGLHLENASVYNSKNADGSVAQGITGVTFVDGGAGIGGGAGYYAVEENGDPMARPTVTDGDEYNTVIVLDDEDDVFSRSANEIAMGAAVAVGGGAEGDVLTVENCYLWTAGFKRTSLFADDQTVQLVVRDSRIVCPGADNYKKGWQALYGGSRCTLLQNGDCWFYNSETVTEGWGALAIDSAPGLDLYAVNCEADVLGGGYVSYTPGDGTVNFYGVRADSAQYGVFVTGNSESYLHGLDDLDDLDDAAETYMTEADHAALAESVTGDGRTHITADYAAYVTHQGGGNSPTTAGYLFAEHSVLSTENVYEMVDNSHFLNDENGGTSWFWTEFWRGSTCLCRSTNAAFEFENCELISRTGVIFRTIVNWEGSSKSFSLADDVEAVGNSLVLRNMTVTGDIRNDDIYRNLYVELEDASVDGAMVSTTVEDWNALWTVEALESSAAYEKALAEQASWAQEIPNPTYDAEFPYADFEIDLETVSANLTAEPFETLRGICLTLKDGAVWTVAGESSLVSLTLEKGAEIKADGYDIFVNCDGLKAENGEKVGSLSAGEYENVVFVKQSGVEIVEIDGESYVLLDALKALLGLNAKTAGGKTTVLKGAKLLDSQYDGEQLDVLVQDGKIVAVGEDLDGDEVIDLAGYTLLPGLIDAHVHVASNAGYNLELLATWAQQGITSVREEGMLSASGEMEFYELIQEANADPQNAALVSCGKYFDVSGGYGMGPTGNMGIEITNADEVAAEVEYKAELGYSQVKVGVNSDDSRMNADELTAAIETAHANGMPVAAHISYAKHLEELVGYGIDEAAHTPSDEMSEALIAAMIEKGVSMNSSGAESSEEMKIENLENFYAAGGILTVGTDLMRNYDTAMTALLDEMRVMLKAGLSLQEVIACATHNNAAALGLATGDIAAGLDADLIAVKGEVDESLDALEAVTFVMNNGVVIVE